MDTTIIEQQQIKESAYKLFREKGYGGVCLNDIAKDSGIRGFLIMDYFKNKENLFDLIVREQMYALFDNIERILNNNETSLSQKVQLLIHCYFSFMKEDEHLNLFILREIKTELETNTETKYGDLLENSVFASQIKKHLDEFQMDYKVSVIDLFLDLTSLCVFPLLVSPSITSNKNQDYSMSFERHLDERKELIFSWFMMILMV
jgi:AcrR family transcriptional regulator